MESKQTLREKYKDIIRILSNNFYTYLDDEGVVSNELPLEELDEDWCSGCSKICVITDDDIVFKTGFKGYSYDYDYDTGEFYEDPLIEKWDVDYCDLEFNVYVEACNCGVEKFFAKMVQVAPGVYAQEKCDIVLEELLHAGLSSSNVIAENSLTDMEIRDFVRKNGLGFLYDKTGAGAIRILMMHHSVEDLAKLENFLYDYDINDLHNCNMGIFNGELKIFDFSGFGSDTSEILKKKSKLKI